MSKQNQIRMFIELLFEALEADRSTRMLGVRAGADGKNSDRRLILRDMASLKDDETRLPDCVDVMSNQQGQSMLEIRP
jgi:hypothetical protein